MKFFELLIRLQDDAISPKIHFIFNKRKDSSLKQSTKFGTLTDSGSILQPNLIGAQTT